MSQAHAERAGMPVYHGSQPGIVVCAAKVVSLEPHTSMPGVLVAAFSDFAKEMPLDPKWIQANHPQVGGYIVIPEGGGGAFMHTQQFEREFSPAPEDAPLTNVTE